MNPINTSNLDDGFDLIRLARPDLLAAVQAINVFISAEGSANIGHGATSVKAQLDLTADKADDLAAAQAATAAAVDALEAAGSSVDARIDALESAEIGLHASVHSAIDAALVELESADAAMDIRIDTLEAADIALDARIDTLEAADIATDVRVDLLEATGIAIDARVDALEALDIGTAAIDAMDARVDALEGAGAATDAAIASLQEADGALDYRAYLLEAAGSAMNYRIGALEATDLGIHAAVHTELDVAIDALQAADTAIDVRVDALEGMTANISSLEGTSAAHANDLASLELADYAALRAYTGTNTRVLLTGSGVAGLFRLDAGDTTSADNGGTVIVTATGSKRYKRIFSGMIAAEWFGALDTANDAPVIQAALNTGKSVMLPAGTFTIDATLELKADGQQLVGQGAYQTILYNNTNSAPLIRTSVDAGDEVTGYLNTAVRSMTLRGNAATTEGLAVIGDTDDDVGSTGNERGSRVMTVSNVRILDVGAGAGLRVSSWKGLYEQVEIYNCLRGVKIGSQVYSASFVNLYVMSATNEGIYCDVSPSSSVAIAFAGSTVVQGCGTVEGMIVLKGGGSIHFQSLYMETPKAGTGAFIHIRGESPGTATNVSIASLHASTGLAYQELAVLDTNAQCVEVSNVDITDNVTHWAKISGASPTTILTNWRQRSGLTTVARLADTSTAKRTVLVNFGDTNLQTAEVRVAGNQIALGSTALASLGSFNIGTNGTVVALGYDVLKNATAVKKAIAIGSASMDGGTIIRECIAIGDEALRAVQAVSADYSPSVYDGTRNIAIGGLSQRFTSSGNRNVTIGRNSGGAITTGTGITALGSNAMASSCPVDFSGQIVNPFPVTASDITAVGHNALQYCRAAEHTAVGADALQYIKSGDRNTALGANALRLRDYDLSANGKVVNWVTIAGTYTQSGTTVTVTATASNAVAGNQARVMATSGALGVVTGDAVWVTVVTAPNANSFTFAVPTSGTASGNMTVSAVETATTRAHATWNTAVGAGALENGTAGNSNTAVGMNALAAATSSNNVAVGTGACETVTSGGNNTAVGYHALWKYIDNTNYTGTGSTAIGAGASVSGNSQVQLGVSGTTTYAYGAVQDRSDARDKADVRDTALGLDFINRLRPVDFRWDMREDYGWGEKDGSQKRTRFHHGLIAQEVKAAMDAAGIDFGGYQDHAINGGVDVLSIGYAELIAPLVKAVQELSARVAQLEGGQ
jgi:hypothetical protein